jgi:endonuclease-3 related protein
MGISNRCSDQDGCESGCKEQGDLSPQVVSELPRRLYDFLLAAYGPQGWWPLVGHPGVQPTSTGRINGYHPADYRFPENRAQRFEICVGAVLTQNTSWVQVEKVLLALHQAGLLGPEPMLALASEDLEQLILPAGYFRQKRRKLQALCAAFQAFDAVGPKRRELLSIWGIGPETADSILLYAYQQPCFVVDAYTRRILEALGVLPATASYDQVQQWFSSGLSPEVVIFQEYHALLVEHAKRFYSVRPRGLHCPLRGLMQVSLGVADPVAVL